MSMSLNEVMKDLAARANPNAKKTYLRHGAPEPLFGVRIGDLKPLQKKLKGQQDLALALYQTKNHDAMYLAGLIADGTKMTREQLEDWVDGATWHMLAGYTVPWVAAEHPDAVKLASQWIDSPRELTALTGWATLSSVVATAPDDKLPVKELRELLDRCARDIHTAPNHVRYAMNGFIISCGTHVAPLADKAMATARKIGEVHVDMGNTACQVPAAEEAIIKARRGAAVAPKRKGTRS